MPIFSITILPLQQVPFPQEKSIHFISPLLQVPFPVRSSAPAHISRRTWSSYRVPASWNEGRWNNRTSRQAAHKLLPSCLRQYLSLIHISAADVCTRRCTRLRAVFQAVPPPHMTALSAELLRMYGTLCTMNRFLLRNL